MLISAHGRKVEISTPPEENQELCLRLADEIVSGNDKNAPSLPEFCSATKFQQNNFTSSQADLTRESAITHFLDLWSQRLSQAGAVLGLATLICPQFRMLRAVGAMSISILSSTPVAATLLASGSYLSYRQAPFAKAAMGRMASGDYRGHKNNIVDDGLFLGSYSIGLLGLGVGWASFGLGAKTFFRTRRDFFQEKYTPKLANSGAYTHGDAVRRAVQDPEQWIQFGSSRAELYPWQRDLLIGGGRVANRILIGGSAAFGVGRLGLNGMGLWQGYHDTGQWDFGSTASVLAHFALDVGPGITTLLYRGARGDRGFNLGPALSQELSEVHYADPALREIVYHRIRTSVPPIRSQQEFDFLNNSQADLRKIEASLAVAETLEPPRAPIAKLSLLPSLGNFHETIEIKGKAVQFAETARDPLNRETALRLSNGPLAALRASYESGAVSPVGVLRYIQQHPALKNSAIFPRDLSKGSLARVLLERAQESEQRFQSGTARPLEGVFVPVKDVFPALDGIMMVGSKTSRIYGVQDSPVLKSLLEKGAIPFPVGMVAAANGGSGMNAGYGYIPHPHRPEFDPAGSSSATAHVLGLDDFPAVVGIGTDTGGSVTAPAGSVGLTGFVPPRQFLSTDNMIPFDTSLDRVGVLSLHPKAALLMVKQLSSHLNGHAIHALQPSRQRPAIAYVKEVVKQASPESRAHFSKQMETFKKAGYEVYALGEDWNFLVEAPLLLYPIDAYGAAAFAHTNPMQRNLFEPPRRSLDRNLWKRLPRGEVSLRYGLFDQARQLTTRYQTLVREKLGSWAILASPSTEAIPTAKITAGEAGPLLDQHDRVTMAKNRIPEWAQINLPAKQRGHVGVVLSGPMKDLTTFLN